jgi:putative FmdB family regulatory protein
MAPTYDYECSSCGHTFEEFQSMTEKRLTKCPKCKKLSLHRLLGTGSGIIFKGSGFYQTDYKDKTSSSKSSASKKADAHSCSAGCPHKACPSNPAQ